MKAVYHIKNKGAHERPKYTLRLNIKKPPVVNWGLGTSMLYQYLFAF